MIVEDRRPMAESRTTIGPTAHYTAAVWERRGLSHPALATSTGRVLYWTAWPATILTSALGGTRLDEFLYARHVLIDRLLEAAIERGEVSQVIEVATGMSPRGWRFARRHGDRLTYVETDLPEMASRKRDALERTGSLGPEHRVEVVDALDEGGPRSLEALAGQLDPERGLAIVTEGLLSYLDRHAVLSLWRRAAADLSRFPHGLMLSDLHLASENAGLVTAIGVRMLSAFVRGRVEMHFDDEGEVLAALAEAGFEEAELHSGAEVSEESGAASVHVLEARRAGAGDAQPT
jgi:O-methyltransferase involved in polyketide biosynthesis